LCSFSLDAFLFAPDVLLPRFERKKLKHYSI
jgi:hypothetical protein